MDARKRTETIAALEAEEFDLLVIGGGITGAGIALDAVSRGMRVALVEMQDYAGGTSSRSTKLIHGGLRYLKQFEFKLVREVGRERAILHHIAGHIVLPEKMLLPIVKGGTFGKFGLRWGLWLYDRLAKVRESERRHMLTREQAAEAEPWLKVGGLLGAGLYSEYRTDDARLTVEVLKTAARLGALCINYARVEDFLMEGTFIAGAIVKDAIGGKTFNVRAKQTVNAAGPWVDGLRKIDHSLEGKRLHHTKGVHIVVSSEQLPLRQSVYFDVGDGRMIFAIPRYKWTYIGTTDTNFEGDLQHPRATAADVDYLIAATNRMFSRANINRSHVESSWAGIRPLIHEDGKSPSQLSRKDELFYSKSGLITIAGGKLTGYRKMAEKVVDVVAKRLVASGKMGHSLKPCCTDSLTLTGYEYQSNNQEEGNVYRLAIKYAVKAEEVDWLQNLFGSNAEEALKLAGGNDKLSVLRGALRYTIQSEGVMRLGDFFVRRSALLYFGRNWIEASLPTAQTVFEETFGKDYDADPGMEFALAYDQAVTFE